MTDQSQRFIFDDSDIRGELVRLEESFQQVLSHHDYPAPVVNLLGEFMAAAALLSSTIKFEGTLILQARSEDGEIPLIMAEASSQQTVRAIARNAEKASSDDFQQLLKNGQLAITIDPNKGKSYQGIVSLEGDSFARCLEQYFEQSEQLSTRIWLACDGNRATGMLLQELPANEQNHSDRDAELATQPLTWPALYQGKNYLIWHSTNCFTASITRTPLRLFDANSWRFECSCSRDKTINALLTLGQEELEQALLEEGQIMITCEFCHHHYRFNDDDIKAIFDQPIH